MKPIVAILVFCAISLPAQTAKPPAKPPTPAASNAIQLPPRLLRDTDGTQTDPPTPVVTPLQTAELQACDAKLEAAEARAQAQYTREALPWQQRRSSIIAEMLKANPGFQWHDAQGTTDTSRLVPKPPPAPAPAK